jgi:glycine C-acetyltransferase
VRLCKAARYRYANADMDDLEAKLKEAQKHRFRLIVTDAVFSMDGNVAPMDKICQLAEQYDALVMIDECHSAGVVGAGGRGVTELFDVGGKVDIITGTLGKALGGGIGGFTTGRREIIQMLRQRSRPYLFSNSIPPSVAGAGIAAFDLLGSSAELHDQLVKNTRYFMNGMQQLGFDIKPSRSAIVAVMLYDAPLSQKFAERLLQEGIYVVGFYYPVVPKEQARIRVQLSAAHTQEHLDRALTAFAKIGRELNVIAS